VNKVRMPALKATVIQRLMSGALWTSFSNGWDTLTVLSYLAMRAKHPSSHVEDLVEFAESEFIGFVEGDDGISLDVGITEELMRRTGFEDTRGKLLLQLDRREHFGKANFCGITCDPDTLTITTSPLRAISTFSLLRSSYFCAKRTVQHGLIRAKALSYLYLFRDCPVVGPLAHWAVQRTRAIQHRTTNDAGWKMMFAETALRSKAWMKTPNIVEGTRLVVESEFAFPIADQLRVEAALQGPQPVVHVRHLVSDDLYHITHNALTRTSCPVIPEPVSKILYDGFLKGTRKQPAKLKAPYHPINFDAEAFGYTLG